MGPDSNTYSEVLSELQKAKIQNNTVEPVIPAEMDSNTLHLLPEKGDVEGVRKIIEEHPNMVKSLLDSGISAETPLLSATVLSDDSAVSSSEPHTPERKV